MVLEALIQSTTALQERVHDGSATGDPIRRDLVRHAMKLDEMTVRLKATVAELSVYQAQIAESTHNVSVSRIAL